MKSSFLPKYEQKIVRISALTTQGKNHDKFLFIFWEKRWLHKFILKITNLYWKILLNLLFSWILFFTVEKKNLTLNGFCRKLIWRSSGSHVLALGQVLNFAKLQIIWFRICTWLLLLTIKSIFESSIILACCNISPLSLEFFLYEIWRGQNFLELSA